MIRKERLHSRDAGRHRYIGVARNEALRSSGRPVAGRRAILEVNLAAEAFARDGTIESGLVSREIGCGPGQRYRRRNEVKNPLIVAAVEGAVGTKGQAVVRSGAIGTSGEGIQRGHGTIRSDAENRPQAIGPASGGNAIEMAIETREKAAGKRLSQQSASVTREVRKAGKDACGSHFEDGAQGGTAAATAAGRTIKIAVRTLHQSAKGA